jgi:4-hydroxy-tetrahydrodipicolinate reductase
MTGRPIRISIAGVTGWVGKALAAELPKHGDFELVSAVSRSSAGQTVGAVTGIAEQRQPIESSVARALDAKPDVLIDYTSAEVVAEHVLEAVRQGVNVVVGTSGLTEEQFREIDAAAIAHNVGVVAAGNFAISAVLLQHFAEIAARHMPSWEIIDYAGSSKRDAPSGTARELAGRLAAVGASSYTVPVAETIGEPTARGVALHGTQVHSVRLPGIVIGVEALFGLPDERLTLQYVGGGGPGPYVGGTLLAARHVSERTGVRRGLDQLLGL